MSKKVQSSNPEKGETTNFKKKVQLTFTSNNLYYIRTK